MVFTSPVNTEQLGVNDNLSRQETHISDNLQGARIEQIERRPTLMEQYAANVTAINELIALHQSNLAESGVAHLVLAGWTDAHTTDREKYPLHVGLYEKSTIV